MQTHRSSRRPAMRSAPPSAEPPPPRAASAIASPALTRSPHGARPRKCRARTVPRSATHVRRPGRSPLRRQPAAGPGPHCFGTAEHSQPTGRNFGPPSQGPQMPRPGSWLGLGHGGRGESLPFPLEEKRRC